MVKRWYLSKKDLKKLKNEIQALYPKAPFRFRSAEKVVEKNLPEIIIVDGEPAFFIIEGVYYPLLKPLLSGGYEWVERIVVVDEGAVKPLLRGADVMIPGIRDIASPFSLGDPVVVIEEKYRKPIVVGKALIPSNYVAEEKRGKAIKNLHRVGDRLWSFVKGL